MECGIVGLPNVGKSTLFNALTATATAQAANYPFCTIEPNVGTVCVPDHRLSALALCTGAPLEIPTQLTFVDIAGLVKGASQGEGLGNQFLGHIRKVDAIIQVVRCFEHDDIIHVSGKVDPLRDIDIIETELMLADLQSIENRLAKKKQDELFPLLKKAQDILGQGKWACKAPWTPQEAEQLHRLDLLTLKPMIYVCNISETPENNSPDLVASVEKYGQETGRPVIIVCNQLEADLAEFDAQEREVFLKEAGQTQTGLTKIIQCAYEVLGLTTYFTAGPKEIRAWTIQKGATSFDAAGVIHTDFQKGFIRAEVVAYDDYVASGSIAKAKEDGKWRSEGKDYLVNDGDVILFRFNV